MDFKLSRLRIKALRILLSLSVISPEREN